MDVTLAHPFRLTGIGALATLVEGSPAHAAQLAGHTLSTNIGERPLAPRFGLPDPEGSPVDAGQIAACLSTCTPELAATNVRVSQTPDGRVTVTVTVDWTEETP